MPGSPARTRKIPRAVFILVAFCVVAVFCFWRWKSSGSDVPASALTVSETTAKPEFAKLNGRWIRPDGGYIVEIKGVDSGGRIEAAYFNPSPIYVSRAEASMDSGAIKVFIELRAPNYPGSTYTLAYDPEGDQLQGIYYQALEQQTYEVVFERME